MKNSQNKRTLQIVLIVLIAVVTLGIGYAAISAVNLIINGNATANVEQNNFKVHFTQAQAISGSTGASGTSTIDSQDDTKATFDVTGLTKVGDYAEAVYTVRNDSNGIGAEITLNLTSSNTEYFKVTETILDNKLQAGEETTAKVKVEMIKTPITDAVSTTITATLTAIPVENATASGGDSDSKSKPGTFAGDSWTEIAENIRNNNTSMYKIGDTKVVNINGTDYTLRIINKSTDEKCSSDSYSQTACGFVVEFADIIVKSQMRDTNTNVGGYPATLVHDYLNNTLFGQLPQELQNVIKTTKVISSHGCFGTTIPCPPDNNGENFISNDKLYLLSIVEVFRYPGSDTASDTSNILDYYREATMNGTYCGRPENCYTGIIKKYEGSDTSWWLRSTTVMGESYFRNVGDSGFLNYNGSSLELGVSPAFRIG